MIVIERSFSPASDGAVTAEVRAALEGTATPIRTVVAGLGGRPVTADGVRDFLARARAGTLPRTEFLGLRQDVISHETARDTLLAGSPV